MLQPQALVKAGLLLVDVERRHLRRVEHGEPIHRNLDLTGRQLGVGRARGPCPHDALDLDDPLVADRLGGGVRIRCLLGARHHLGDAVAIAEVEEGEMPVIPPTMHPTGQRDPLAVVPGAQLATGVRAEGGAHGSVNGSRCADAHRTCHAVRRMTMMTRQQRLLALREALRREQSIGPFSIPAVAGLGSGFLASFVADALLFDIVDTPWRQFIDALVFALVAAPVWLLVQRRAVRHAIEVMTWLNGWETERWQHEVGNRLPALPRSSPQMLDTLPDTMGLRPLRVELLAARGELDEAWQRLEALPTDTPWQRFERAALEEWISFVSNGPEHLGAMAAAEPDVRDDRSLAARAMVAAAKARRAAVGGGDAIGPLAAMRPELGDRPQRYAFSYRTGVILGVLVISLVASLAVMITAAIIR